MSAADERYLSADGQVITGEMLDQWAQDAQEGLEGYTFEHISVDELPHMRGKMSTHTLRLPDGMWDLAQKHAQAKGMTVASFVREAIAEKLIAAV